MKTAEDEEFERMEKMQSWDVVKTYKCTACSCDYTEDEGGVQGNFGMLPMNFCPTCFACACDMVDQLCPKEWVGLTDEEVEASKPPLSNDAVVWELAVEWAEAKLKEKNT
jgi:hypothetical protein